MSDTVTVFHLFRIYIVDSLFSRCIILHAVLWTGLCCTLSSCCAWVGVVARGGVRVRVIPVKALARSPDLLHVGNVGVTSCSSCLR